MQQEKDAQVSSDEDNFDEDGQLPEVLTKAATLLSLWDRHAALATDRFLVHSKNGQHDLKRFVPEAITFTHKPDSNGTKAAEKALLLISQPASGGDKVGFEKATMMRDGVYLDMDDPSEFISVSKKLSMQAQGWKSENMILSGHGYLANKAARGQLTYACVLKDLTKHCTAPTLLINDFVAGVGRIGVVALHTKCSQEARRQE